jgi:hypothetical protein
LCDRSMLCSKCIGCNIYCFKIRSHCCGLFKKFGIKCLKGFKHVATNMNKVSDTLSL